MRLIKNKGVTLKFLMYFTLIVVIPVLMINVFSVKAYRQIVIDDAIALIQQQQASVATNLDNELKSYNRILAAIVYNSKSAVLDHVTSIHRASDPKNKYDLTESMDEKIRLIMHASNNIDGVYFIFDDDGYYYYNNPLEASISSIKALQLYSDAHSKPDKTQKGKLMNGLTTDSNGRYTLLFGVHPSASDYRNDVDIVLLSAYTEVLSSAKSTEDKGRHGSMYIIDEDGIIMYCEDQELEGTGIESIDGLSGLMTSDTSSYTTKIKDEDTLINIYEMEDVGWKIVNLVSQSYVTRQADRVLAISLYINLGMIIFFILFTVFFFRGMIRPINELIRGMRHIELGRLNHRLKVVGNDEIQQVGRSFNKMASRLSRLIEDNQLKEREKMEAEVAALQSQINPHFIVNSLSTIKFMAMVSKNHNIQRVSEMLMRILNNSFRSRSHFNTVQQELELVKSYVEIMLIRYGNDFEVRYRIDETLLDKQILKLIVQPMVENSITHGLSEKEGNKILLISVRLEADHLVFEVLDNGVGMDKAMMEKVLKGSAVDCGNRLHIGISNTQNRIELNHGGDYGVRLKSREGCYTKVTMVLPLCDDVTEEATLDD